MARGHALMGALAWLAGAGAAAELAGGADWPILVIGTPVCAGWAIIPDIDHPGSKVARSVGPASQGVAELVAFTGRLLHQWTRTTWDRVDEDGHRTITHTFLGAAVFGLAVTLAGWLGGHVAAAVLVFWPAHLGLSACSGRMARRARFGRGRNAVRVRWSLLAAAALAAAAAAGTPGSAWWLGLAAGGGAAIHLVGDMATNSAVPAVWPIVLRDERGRPQRWRPIGLPRKWRFATGQRFEVVIVHRALIAALAAVLLLITSPVWGPVVQSAVQH